MSTKDRDGRRIGVYPGSFNPPTTAHLAIAEAARSQRRLTQVDFVMSAVALAKEGVTRPLLPHRLQVLEQSVAHLEWATIAVTPHQLLADIADGYDVIVMGADKWAQVNDPVFYGDSPAARDAALARLPELAVAAREPFRVPAEHLLDLPPHIGEVSSTAARSGAIEHMTDAASAFAERTGAWTDPDRYERWIESGT